MRIAVANGRYRTPRRPGRVDGARAPPDGARCADHPPDTSVVAIALGDYTCTESAQLVRPARSMISTWAPAGSSCVASGTTNRQLATANEPSRCEPGPPTGAAVESSGS